jgi:RNA polymerase primary sigma factor
MELGQNDYDIDSAGGEAVKPRRETRTTTRRRVPHAPQQRARRLSPAREGADLDQLYLSEMAHAHVLTPAQEVEIATSIVSAERAVIAALVKAPAGRKMLLRLAEELAGGIADVRDVVLNPDQEGLDLVSLRHRVVDAFREAAHHASPEELERAIGHLGDIRLDADLIEGVSGAVRASEDAADREGARAFDRARRELRRSKDRLVVGNLRLVLLFARKYLGRGIPLLDLVQEGNLGLMRAADKFDHRRGFRFNTYAAWWIRQALQRALLDRTLRLPVHVADDRRRVGKVRAVFSAQNRREPTSEEIAQLTGLARERIDNILNLPAQPASLDAPIGEDGDASLVDLVAGKEAAPDEAASLRALGADLQDLLEGLTPREQQVLRMRFGMGKEREHTLEEVGKELSLTRERIRQIERAALAKLRARSDRLDLASYL